MRRITAFVVCGLIAVCGLAAQTEIDYWITGDLAYYPPNLGGYGIEKFAPIDYSTVTHEELENLSNSDIKDEGRDLGGQAVEMRATFGQELEFPLLRGNSILTAGNNVKIRLKEEISPVTANLVVESVFTPVAFLLIDSALSIGTGWAVGDISGLSYNTPEKTFEPAPFKGAVTTAEVGATFQFDFGLLVPGDWTHIVTVYRAGLQYEAFTAANADEPWMWQADNGENFNGWNWKQTGVLGYQMPALRHIDTTGLLIETEQRITKRDESTMDAGGWGSDFMKVYVSPFVVVQINPSHALTLQLQFARGRDYTEETIGNAHFSYRKVDTDSPVYWYFRRAALSYRYEY
ncbi:MAG: hypothetical protein U5P10_14255 [Spirochaetia bacterium]|nr:hypothetical protein [Spirochaetia bacterium]